MKTGPRIVGLYAIADTQYLDDTRLIEAVTQAVAGGARVIQYKDKGQVFPYHMKYTGREEDQTGLHYYRARCCDKDIERSVSEDPRLVITYFRK